MSSVSFTRLAAAALVVAGAVSPALSADLYGRQPYPPPAQPYAGYTQQSPTANWAGAYLGIQAGYSFGTLKNSIDGIGSQRSGANGALIGGYAGVNAMIGGNIIIGAEGDLNISDQRQTQVFGVNSLKGSSTWNGSIRGRLGTSFDRYMPFVTGGLAFADNTLSVNGNSSSTTQMGIALGAGIEGFVTDKITLKGEVIYEGFGDANRSDGVNFYHTNISSTALRIGAAYRF